MVYNDDEIDTKNFLSNNVQPDNTVCSIKKKTKWSKDFKAKRILFSIKKKQVKFR